MPMRAVLWSVLLSSCAASSPSSFHPPRFRNLRYVSVLPISSYGRRFYGTAGLPPPMEKATARDDSSSAGGGGELDHPLSVFLSMERQFEEFRSQLMDSGSIRERIRSVATEMESALRVMHACIILVHQSVPLPEVLKKTKAQIVVLRDLYGRLAEILRECPGQYYRYHADWRSETQTAVSLLAFLHYLETESLLTHAEAQSTLGWDALEFGLDIEDYLIGLCLLSNELPRYVVNQVTAGDYDCPRKLLKFLTELHSSFQMLNLRNDFLRRKFDGIKYDLRRVEEVYYDVKIRGLAQRESNQEQSA